MNAFRAVLLQILPPGTPVIRTQINRVPEPNGDNWVSMTPLFRNRLATNYDTYTDSFFIGYIEGTYLTVMKTAYGAIAVGNSLFGEGVASGSVVTGFDANRQQYIVSPSQQSGTTEISAGSAAIEESIDFVVQVDIYGSSSADNAQKIAVLLRDEWGCVAFQQLNPNIQTLYTDDPKQMAFINAEQQYEQRWTLDAHLQVNPIVQVPQQFADELEVSPIAVETIQQIP